MLSCNRQHSAGLALQQQSASGVPMLGRTGARCERFFGHIGRSFATYCKYQATQTWVGVATASALAQAFQSLFLTDTRQTEIP